MSSTASAKDGKLHFPSQEAITAYLAKHPLISDPLISDSYNQEKKIKDAVAQFFANSRKVPMGVQMGVMLTISELNKKFGLPQSAVMALNMNLTEALQDCANEQEIQLEKDSVLDKK
jgi:hypothetical protein